MQKKGDEMGKEKLIGLCLAVAIPAWPAFAATRNAPPASYVAGESVRSISEPKLLPVVHQAIDRKKDLRKCLDLKDDKSIIQCAERGRK